MTLVIMPPGYRGIDVIINEYFEKLNYPKVKNFNAALSTDSGYVYIVEFEKTGNGFQTPPCYAIIRNGVCSAYFADLSLECCPYLLALRQHIGREVMESEPKRNHQVREIKEAMDPKDWVWPKTSGVEYDAFKKTMENIGAIPIGGSIGPSSGNPGPPGVPGTVGKSEPIIGTAWSNVKEGSNEGCTGPVRNDNPVSATPISTEKIIGEYFKKLNYYPEIHKINLAYSAGWRFGCVYLVTFVEMVTTPAMPGRCYVIVKDGVVTGYPEDFWSDADKYKLVLKQHIGMLEMEKYEAALRITQPPPKPPEESRSGMKMETVEALVSTYEYLLKQKDVRIQCLEEKINDIGGKEKEIRAVRRDEHSAIHAKIGEIKDILDGKKPKAPEPEKQKTLEELAVEAAIEQDDADILSETKLPATGMSHVQKRDVPQGEYEDIGGSSNKYGSLHGNFSPL